MEAWEALGLLFVFLALAVALFGPVSFLVSMIFSRRKHRKMVDNVMERVSTTVDEYGRDPLTNMKTPLRNDQIAQAKMIQANFVVGPGWWNQWIAGWHTLIGGNITSFDDVLMLARQEVLQSLRDKASEDGFDEVVNVRLESARLTYLAKKSNKYIEIFAYGTAIKYA
ncbi:TPA: YbjQ family protein [Candidatus Thalassarchaeaceae archaeon]|jgi:uncharacterized protein YbjQ (UPF0145 family)|nr:MAG TPA: hypothetical protein D7I15_03025 [Candidatus Poseidoniales archaeon]HII43575.1 YbjQ family protein [Candidatus Thalassarchaeaceae archaeon]|tara:strand:- start:2288 stop:2791 length:504 start_codon:yes stop_codon:yes gene_type:complete